MPALAMTDTDNLFGALEFSEALAASGIQPIIGCTLAVDFGDSTASPLAEREPRPADVSHRAARPGKRATANLMRLSTRPILETPTNEAPHLKLAGSPATDGIIA